MLKVIDVKRLQASKAGSKKQKKGAGGGKGPKAPFGGGQQPVLTGAAALKALIGSAPGPAAAPGGLQPFGAGAPAGPAPFGFGGVGSGTGLPAWE